MKRIIPILLIVASSISAGDVAEQAMNTFLTQSGRSEADIKQALHQVPEETLGFLYAFDQLMQQNPSPARVKLFCSTNKQHIILLLEALTGNKPDEMPDNIWQSLYAAGAVWGNHNSN